MLDILNKKYAEKFQRILIAAITIALASQIHINIFVDGFILTLSLFILPVFLYFNDDVNPFHICLGIAAASPLFRGILLFLSGEGNHTHILQFVLTDMTFYLCYGATYYFIYWHRNYRHKGTFFLSIVICDYISNILEISLLLGFTNYTLTIFEVIFLVALLRAGVSCTLSYIYSYFELLLQKDFHEQRYYYFIWSSSAVKSEVYFMEKNISEIERIMKNAYLLNKVLSDSQFSNEYGQLALNIARDVHEVKKDYQNVIKGLGTYFSVENESSMDLNDVLHIATAYARGLIRKYNQDIIIKEINSLNLRIFNYYFLLTILSNIILNAIEAIGQQKNGIITITIKDCGDYLQINIGNNGPNIAKSTLDLIFQPGFSTKFDETGDIFRGIGLPHVKMIIEEQFLGSIEVENYTPVGCSFNMTFSKAKLTNGETT